MPVDYTKLIPALIQVESGSDAHPEGDDHAIGDRNLQYSAYGCLQVRWPVVSDVNVAFGTDYRARQCLGNRPRSIDIFEKYMAIYATVAHLGRVPTMEDCARIWNGGPQGWRNAATVGYWSKVERILLNNGN